VNPKDENQNLEAYSNDLFNGYNLFHHEKSVELRVYDMGIEIESISSTNEGKRTGSSWKIQINEEDLNFEKYISKNKDVYNFVVEADKLQRWSDLIDVINIYARTTGRATEEDAIKMTWAFERNKLMREGKYNESNDLMKYYVIQDKLSKQVIKTNAMSLPINLIAGADVAYNEEFNIMVGAITVLNPETFEIVEQAYEIMKIEFPYIPGLFSFREIPPLVKAFHKLNLKPDIIVCDGHGISHPKGIGMATHLGLELDIPTIGCAKKRLVGYFDKEKIKPTKGSTTNLIWNDEIVGSVLRTRDDTKPMFVSIGHKIDLETSIKYILKMCREYRLPETTRSSDSLVNRILKEEIARS